MTDHDHVVYEASDSWLEIVQRNEEVLCSREIGGVTRRRAIRAAGTNQLMDELGLVSVTQVTSVSERHSLLRPGDYLVTLASGGRYCVTVGVWFVRLP